MMATNTIPPPPLIRDRCDQMGAIYWTLGIFSKPLATVNLPKSPKFSGNFCEVVKIFNFSSEIIFGQLFTGHNIHDQKLSGGRFKSNNGKA